MCIFIFIVSYATPENSTSDINYLPSRDLTLIQNKYALCNVCTYYLFWAVFLIVLLKKDGKFKLTTDEIGRFFLLDQLFLSNL
jgi:hypothetical protein